jgi:hypothetical protein
MIRKVDWERQFVACFKAKLNMCITHVHSFVVFSATLRSGYMLKDTSDFAESVELMMRKTMGISLEEQVS